MKRTPQWLLLLYLLASFFILLIKSPQAVADTGDSAGVIRIDCGTRKDYWDKKTKSYYLADDCQFVEYGETHNVSSDYNKEQIGNQLNTLKSFPNGRRNCYTLEPKPGKNTYYLVRAFFAYGNYDGKRRIPSFDLYIGVNYWATINDSNGDIQRNEVIHVSPTDEINVCLVNTGQGTPFISLLEVWPLQDSRYDQTASSLLGLMTRSKLGMSEDAAYIRYPDDIYGRYWFNRKIENSVRISASKAIDSNTSDNTYQLPKEVLSSAVRSMDESSSLVIKMGSHNSDSDYFMYLHFYDFELHNQQRKMNIAFDDGINVSFTLDYMRPTTLVRNIKQGDYVSKISITSTPDSHLPAMLNAYEIYRVLPQPINSPTDEGDVVAIRDIKNYYNIKRMDWQGDPCRPYTWQGLTCTNDSTPRINSLNLSSCNLMGDIAPSFSKLTKLEALDLSNNNLTGQIREDLAVALENLTYINLTRTYITGPIPKRWEEEETAGHLNISTDNLGKGNGGMSRGAIVGLSVGLPVGSAITIGIAWKVAITFGIKINWRSFICSGRPRRGDGSGRSNDNKKQSGGRKGKSRKQRKESDGGGRERKANDESKGKSRKQRKENDGGGRERKENDERKGESEEQRKESDERTGESQEQGEESDDRTSESQEQGEESDEARSDESSEDDESQSGKGTMGATEI